MNMERETSKELRTFMKNVAWLRTHYGLSKKDMAKLLGVSVMTLTRIERGQFPSQLHISVMYNIQRHFGVRISNQFVDITSEEAK